MLYLFRFISLFLIGACYGVMLQSTYSMYGFMAAAAVFLVPALIARMNYEVNRIIKPTTDMET